MVNAGRSHEEARAGNRHPRDPRRAAGDRGDGLDKDLTAAEVDATLPLLQDRNPKTPFGYMTPRDWETFAGFFADEGLISIRPAADELLTNELLPGEIPE